MRPADLVGVIAAAWGIAAAIFIVLFLAARIGIALGYIIQGSF